jgi:predicted ATP-grasp superfamily ATP-dependent carboligase
MYRVEKDFEVVVCLGAMDLGLRKKVKKYFVVRVNEKRTAMRQRKAHGKVFF